MSELAIEVRGLVKRFDEVVAVNGLELEVKRGECVGLLGPNGAGKTTTLEILEGLQRPTAGQARVLGLSWETDAERLRARVGVQLQETRLYERFTVKETLEFFRGFYARGADVEALISGVKLQEKRDAYVMNLSGGQRQSLAVATALVSEPELVFLDEPTTGLDPQARRAIWDFITSLKERGCTVVLTTHYMEEAERLCDRVFIVDRGRVVAQGTARELIRKLGGAHIIDFSTHPRLERDVFSEVPGVREVLPREEGWVISVEELAPAVSALLAVAARDGSSLAGLTVRPATLDDVFVAMTGRSMRSADAEAEVGANGAPPARRGA
jgi:ABC-2 type transport system ATP-binding protein